MHTCTHAYIHIHTHTHVHACIHTHIKKQKKNTASVKVFNIIRGGMLYNDAEAENNKHIKFMQQGNQQLMRI